MKFLKSILLLPFRRSFWIVMGILLLCLLILFYGHLLEIADIAPLAEPVVRWIVVLAILLFWLISILIREYRKLKADGVLRREIRPPEPEVTDPAEESVSRINEKFREALDDLYQSKKTERAYLKSVPWYIFIGPPGTGKTTALKQAGLNSLIDMDDDLKGHSGTRNCDWFFTQDAVLIDTAGRFVEQRSDPRLDAAEWLGFLDILKKHRGKRALNGIIVAISVRELLGDEEALDRHARDVRKRIDEVQNRLSAVLPVYLMITKLDLVNGFQEYFGDRLSDEDRKQVWGMTFPVGARLEGTALSADLRELLRRIDFDMAGRLGEELDPARRAELFRFPSQLSTLVRPIRSMAERLFAKSGKEATTNLRGVYLTSATQEGSPISRMVAGIASEFGIAAPPSPVVRSRTPRSFFLHDLMTRVVFSEAGLATQNPATVRRWKWIHGGTTAVTAAVALLFTVLFGASYIDWSDTLDRQKQRYTDLAPRLTGGVVPEVVSDEDPDLGLALAAVTDVRNSAMVADAGTLGSMGPNASADLERIQADSYYRALTNVLEPRMVAVLENAMWREMHDYRFQLGALKVYKYLTHAGVHDPEQAADWWFESLPNATAVKLDPTEDAEEHQRRVFARLPLNRTHVAPNQNLIEFSEQAICENLSLAELALDELLALPVVKTQPEWIPRTNATGKPDLVFTRFSSSTLREGIPGAFTRDAFKSVILPNVDSVVERFTAESAFFLSSCADSAATSPENLRKEVLELYYQQFISTWDLLLKDLRLAALPKDDLKKSVEVLEDISSANGALISILRNIAYATDIGAAADEDGGGGMPKQAKKTLMKSLCKVAKFLCKAKKVVPKKTRPSAADPSDRDGMRVSQHFRRIKGVVEEVDKQAPQIDQVVAALLDLKGILETALNSRDPQVTLHNMGGLPALTGDLVASAAELPEPVKTWVVGVADDVNNYAISAVLDRINVRWRADYYDKCMLFTTRRFPFDPGSKNDSTIQDFATLLGPDGIMDSFTKQEIATYIDDKQWRWRKGFERPNRPLKSLKKAREIRDALFSGGAGPGPLMRFTLQPIDLSDNAASVTLSIDGEALQYRHANIDPKQFTWPGLKRSDVVSISFLALDGLTQEANTIQGDWAFLRLIKSGLSPTSRDEVFRLRLSKGPYWALFELKAQSVLNPFDLGIFDGFQCPKGF